MADANGDIARVLEATDIVRLIGEQLALKKKGAEMVGLCPFHSDRSPSMTVSARKQIYKCFSCGAGGDALAFMTEYHKMTFPEAMTFLADRAGIQLTPWKARGGFGGGSGGEFVEHDAGVSREQLAGANRAAGEFFRTILRHPEHGAAAREVIERRGVSAAMVERFGLGAAPDRWDGLLQVVERKGLARGDFAGAGLLKSRESGGFYDGFRHRLMFPIVDTTGRVVAFGARRLRDSDEPKYLNSSESALFIKGKTLYALPQAAEAIKATRTAVVVEGYMDAIACHQAGVCNVVATLGTALTVEGARLLGRLLGPSGAGGGAGGGPGGGGASAGEGRIVLLFDGDAAGQRAAERAIEVLFDSPLDVRIATLAGLTDAKDPDELLKREGGAAVLAQVIERSVEALEYRFARLSQSLRNLGGQARGRAIEEELERLAGLGLARMKPVSQQMAVQRIAQIAGVNEVVVRQAIARAAAQRRGFGERDNDGRGEVGGEGGGPTGAVALVPTGAAEHALCLLVAETQLVEELNDAQWAELAPERFAPGGFRRIAEVLVGARRGAGRGAGHGAGDGAVEGGRALSRASLMAELEYGEMPLRVSAMCSAVERQYGDDLARCRAGLQDLLIRAEVEWLLRAARETTDPGERLELLKRAKGRRGG